MEKIKDKKQKYCKKFMHHSFLNLLFEVLVNPHTVHQCSLSSITPKEAMWCLAPFRGQFWTLVAFIDVFGA